MLILVARRARSLRAERIIDMSTGEIIARYAAAAIVGYLVGSIPNGVLIGKLFGNRDPRAHGSGKTGTTNVLRTLGVGPAALVASLDIAKGVAAVLLARFVFFPLQPGATATTQAWAEAIAGLAAILGHNYSIFIRFSGGRGVATGALAGCFSVLVHSFFDFTLHTTANALLFLILAALATQDNRVDQGSNYRRRRRRSSSHGAELETPESQPAALEEAKPA